MRAIVLNLQAYTDSASVLHTYTRECGRINFIVYGAKKSKCAKSNTLYAPLSIIDITLAQKQVEDTLKVIQQGGKTRMMPRVKEAQLAYIPRQMLFDIRRQTIAIFLAELIYRTLRLPLQDDALYDFMEQTIVELDSTPTPENVHLQFMVGLAERLGFAIDAELCSHLLELPSSRAERKEQLKSLCDYFAEQIDDWQYPNSLEIMSEVFG